MISLDLENPEIKETLEDKLR